MPSNDIVAMPGIGGQVLVPYAYLRGLEDLILVPLRQYGNPYLSASDSAYRGGRGRPRQTCQVNVHVGLQPRVPIRLARRIRSRTQMIAPSPLPLTLA